MNTLEMRCTDGYGTNGRRMVEERKMKKENAKKSVEARTKTRANYFKNGGQIQNWGWAMEIDWT